MCFFSSYYLFKTVVGALSFHLHRKSLSKVTKNFNDFKSIGYFSILTFLDLSNVFPIANYSLKRCSFGFCDITLTRFPSYLCGCNFMVLFFFSADFCNLFCLTSKCGRSSGISHSLTVPPTNTLAPSPMISFSPRPFACIY